MDNIIERTNKVIQETDKELNGAWKVIEKTMNY